jgi:hypothetical protein
MLLITKWVLVFQGKYWSDARKGTWVSNLHQAKWFRTLGEAETQAGLIEASFEAEIGADEFIDVVPIMVPYAG